MKKPHRPHKSPKKRGAFKLTPSKVDARRAAKHAEDLERGRRIDAALGFGKPDLQACEEDEDSEFFNHI